MPLSRLGMLCIGGVVTTVQSTAVVGDGVAVVGTVGHAVGVAREVEPIQWKGDCSAQLIPASLRR